MSAEKPKREFNYELAKAFLAADIPLWKLENECFKTFLKTWTGQNIASDSLIRKVHLKKCYTEVLDSIQNEIRYRKVWVSIDETTDVCDRSVAHFIIGILSKDKDECKSFLINTEHLQVANSTNIARFSEDTVIGFQV